MDDNPIEAEVEEATVVDAIVVVVVVRQSETDFFSVVDSKSQ